MALRGDDSDDMAVDYVLGALEPREAAAFEASLKEDPALRAKVGELRAELALIPQVLSPLTLPDHILMAGKESLDDEEGAVSADALARLMAIPDEVGDKEEASGGGWLGALKNLWVALLTPSRGTAVLATAALAVVVGVLVGRGDPTRWKGGLDPELAIPVDRVLDLEAMGHVDRTWRRIPIYPVGELNAALLERHSSGRWSMAPDRVGGPPTYFDDLRLEITRTPKELGRTDLIASVLIIQDGVRLLAASEVGRWPLPGGSGGRSLVGPPLAAALEDVDGPARLVLILSDVAATDATASCLSRSRQGAPLSRSGPLVSAECLGSDDSWQGTLTVSVTRGP